MTQRRQWLQAASALGATALLPGFAKAQSGAKKFQGVTLNVSTFSAAYPKLLQQYLPEFESLTGARVNFDAPSFPVYNQRADLELSTKGSAYDVVNVTFIYSSRWIHSGWLTPLDDFIRNPNLTPADWDVNDFLPGARAPETGKDGKLYGIPWTAEALLSASSRFDLVQQAGLAYPDTTDDLVKVLRAVNKKERVAGFVSDSHYGWTFVPYLHAFGGDVFRKAPDDLYPTLDTPEAIAAAEYYASLLREFGPDGAITYTPDQVTQALKLGRVNFTDAGQLHLAQLGDPASSKTLKTLQFGQVPKGPAGRFPGTAVHGLGIPTGSKNKEAAWAFIQWALSKQTTRRAVLAGYGSPARRSDIDSREFRARQVINGNDLAQLALDSIELASKTGHMKYRTVSVYPQVDQQLNKAIALIASGQASARQALQQAQAQSITELQRAGLKL
ncbi:extracellular solute-binding protein [Acidovorax sp. SUPP2522]|uniref:ABC transporter substrate-binding protein n=1 Tax=unclassified Acidovorax TaxID=2684926 RepID=UPI00234BFC6D|nr:MULTISPECIES: extracellular solute-binding protein [unclassified Acidovorax]WCM98522.1 extracellular solute-binding protein [Acidovorax sp. GBBC 1281]GKT13942.1 extracellular solute-binding protein [Acidovorax sp. SUPP2522]